MLHHTQQEQQIKQFQDILAQAGTALADCAPKNELDELTAYRTTFQHKTEDFYRENRKLNIGVVGQVKAGKSSFLNTLLFGGQEVLPKAATPKTASLTKMEYAEENVIEVEYYTPEEWETHEDNAAVDLDGDVYDSARELVQMVRERVRAGTLNVEQCLNAGTERLRFDTYEQLIARLNDYVGVDGVYTPLVKSVSLFLHNEQFQGLSIVDTPGLNDPIVSRTIRTKEFIEVCDVVFFLSQTGSFLDSTDWGLLSAQLPQGGVKRLVLIGSKYDSAVRDILYKPPVSDSPFSSPFARRDDSHADNIPDACRIASETLTRRAMQQVAEQQRHLRELGCCGALLEVIEQCKTPMLFSSMACNMLRKSQDKYDREEAALYRKLSEFSNDVPASLKQMGDIAPIQALFEQVTREKEQILQEKSASFVSDAANGLSAKLANWSEQAQNRAAILEKNDRGQLEAQKAEVERRQNEIRGVVSDVFSGKIDKLKREKAEGITALRSASTRKADLTTQTGTREVSHSYEVKASKWYKPWTWGKTETRYYTTTESYRYLVSSEAAENLHSYAQDSASQIERAFLNTLNLSELRRELCRVVVEHMDMGSDNFDSNYFRQRVNALVDEISFPVVHIDPSNVVKQYMGRFQGNITSETEMNALKDALQQALDALLQELILQFDRKAEEFLQQMKTISTQFQEDLLRGIGEEFDGLIQKLEEKEQEIARLNTYRQKLAHVRQALEAVQ